MKMSLGWRYGKIWGAKEEEKRVTSFLKKKKKD